MNICFVAVLPRHSTYDYGKTS